MYRPLTIFSLFVFLSFVSLAQEITVKGKVVLKDGNSPGQLLIINKTTGVGKFGNIDGTFEITVDKSDTIIISVVGYEKFKLCFKDSLYRREYLTEITMRPLELTLKEFVITPSPTIMDIYKQVDSLGINKKEYIPENISAVESPITYLYYVLSKRERSKRAVAEMQNEDRRRKLLKELLKICIDEDLFFLMDEEMDDFIDYCGVSDTMLQKMTQYEFLMHLKKCYVRYSYGR